MGELVSIEIRVIDNGYLVDVQRKVKSSNSNWEWDYDTTTIFYVTIEDVGDAVKQMLKR